MVLTTKYSLRTRSSKTRSSKTRKRKEENNIQTDNEEAENILKNAVSQNKNSEDDDSSGEESSSMMKNLCTKCGVDMGIGNPRQLCGKTYCRYMVDSLKDINYKKRKNQNENTKSKKVKLNKKSGPSLSENPFMMGRCPLNDNIITRSKSKFVENDSDDERADGSADDSDDSTGGLSIFEDSEEFEETEGGDSGEDSDDSDGDSFGSSNSSAEFEPEDEEAEAITGGFVNMLQEKIRNKMATVEEDMEAKYIEKQFDPQMYKITDEESIDTLNKMKLIYKQREPKISDILTLTCDSEMRADLIERVMILKNIPKLSLEYVETRNSINKLINELRDIPSDKTDELEDLRRSQDDLVPSVKNIICSNMPKHDKILMFKRLEHLRDIPRMYAMEKLRADKDYLDRVKRLHNVTDEQLQLRLDSINQNSSNMFEKKLAEMRYMFDKNVFEQILAEYQVIMKSTSDDTENIKAKRWLKYVTDFPLHKKPLPVNKMDPPEKIKKFKDDVRKKLDMHIGGMEQVKDFIIDFINVRINNPNSTRNILGLESSPGMGKSTIAKAIADCLDLPLIEIHMGGQHDIGILKGHSKTYISAQPGQIVQKMCKAGYTNGVVFLDEIDKVSSRHGEMEGALCQLLDPDQNKSFEDYYLGYPVDLSNLLFVVAMNDRNRTGGIVNDRIQIIKIKDRTPEEKVEITISHLAPKIMNNLGIAPGEMILTKEAAMLIVKSSIIKEAGVRQLIRNIETILKKLVGMKLDNSGYFEALMEGEALIITPEIVKKLFWEPCDEEMPSGLKNMYI